MMNEIYVTDTHSFLWYISGDDKLSNVSRKIYEICEFGQGVIVIPSIVLLEALYLCEKRRISYKFTEIFMQISKSSNYKIYPLDEKIVLDCVNINLPEIHDRIIVATAKLLGATLITKDRKIRESKIIETIW